IHSERDLDGRDRGRDLYKLPCPAQQLQRDDLTLPTLYVQRQFGLAQLRLQYMLDYVTVGSDPYLLTNSLQPTLTIPESDPTFTQAWVRYQYEDFKSVRDGEPAVPVKVNQTRDGVNWMVGGMQYFMFTDDRGHVRAGYTFDTDRTGGGDVSQAIPGQPTSADW